MYANRLPTADRREGKSNSFLIRRFTPMAILCLPVHFVLGPFSYLFKNVLDGYFTKL